MDSVFSSINTAFTNFAISFFCTIKLPHFLGKIAPCAGELPVLLKKRKSWTNKSFDALPI